MLAGGVGLISSNNVEKWKVDHGDCLLFSEGQDLKLGLAEGLPHRFPQGLITMI